jgi:hypothetical protein
MQQRRAREILRALVQGVDPLNGDARPADTVLQRADVLLALLAGSAALGRHAARMSRRSHHARRVGRDWSMEEHSDLLELIQADEALADLAARHGRTLRAIEARLQTLGLVTADQRTTPDRLGTREQSVE